MKARMHRRQMLRGALGSMLALPLLDLAVRDVKAALPGVAPDGYPLRFVVFFNPNGCWPATWFPTGTETDFALAQSMASLEPFKDKLVILDGVDMPAVDAGPGEDHQQGMGGDDHVPGLPVNLGIGAEILDAGVHEFGAHVDGEGGADEASHDREDKVHRADVLMVRRKQIAADTGWMMVVLGVVMMGGDGAHGSGP